jgi:glycosyltransferase involved in cell wall biosynthesis
VKTSVLRAVGGWRDSVIEDWDLINRIAKAGGRFERVEKAEYRYRQHTNSLSQRINRAADQEQFTNDEQMVEILGDKLIRYPLEAVFFGQASAAQNYVRGQVPAEHLPGVATDLIWEHNFGADTSIWLYPGQLSYEQAFNSKLRDMFQVRILDADDNYLSPKMIRSFERAGRKELARFWKGDIEWHARFARNADAVFVSTPALAETYAATNDHVYVLPNSILEADWRRVRKPEEDGKVRIGWAAGRQHDPDADIVMSALRAVSKRHSNVEVVVVGVVPDWDFDHTRKPFTPSLATYRQELATFDISIAPLKLTDMNRGKSDLKWLESSMAGAAFVCTDYEPYSTVTDGVTGLKCASRDQWEDALEHLIVDPSDRARMVQTAQSEVRESRNAVLAAADYAAAILETRDRAGIGAPA